MMFVTEGFFEEAIESWSEWDLNQRTQECHSQTISLRNNRVFLHSEIFIFTLHFDELRCSGPFLSRPPICPIFN